MKRRCHPILQNLVQLAEALPFDSIFLANQLAGNKRATLAYVPDVDLLHYGEGFSFIAEGPLAHGFNVAVAGYTLAPEATMDGIVREARISLHWLHQRLSTLGGDPARLYVGGWSAGGHLTAMLMDEPLIAGGLAISGLFDLEPIRLCYLNDTLDLDAEQARRNSPLLNLPARAAKLIIAYGAAELPELQRQSREFGAAWTAHGLPGEMIEVADCHHYAVLEQLAQPDGLLAQTLTITAGVEPR
jgi:acetyl esterase/lipase